MPDTTAMLNEISGGLSNLSHQVLGSTNDDRTFQEVWNWQQPSMTRHDLADRIESSIARIHEASSTNIEDPTIIDRLSKFPASIASIQSNGMPNFAGGNCYMVVQSIEALLNALDALLSDYVKGQPSWDEIEDQKLLPAALKKRLERTQRGIQNVEEQTEHLDTKVEAILEAYNVANELPASLGAVDEARTKYEASVKQIEALSRKAEVAATTAEEAKEQATVALGKARQTAGDIEEVHSAATRQGLGKAFQERADDLKMSTYILMALLAATLGVGAWVSHGRVSFLQTLMETGHADLNLLWVNVALTVVSIAAPIWFAWLLTRQIGQRFRLAEDYGYKASVAKAYEGYRRETIESGDQELMTRLLGIALDRVQEAPLSHIEIEESASPLSDFLRGFHRDKKPAEGSS